MQAAVWRIPKGGDTPKIWYQSSKLASPCIGANGLRLNPAGTPFYITVTIDARRRVRLLDVDDKQFIPMVG